MECALAPAPGTIKRRLLKPIAVKLFSHAASYVSIVEADSRDRSPFFIIIPDRLVWFSYRLDSKREFTH